MRKKSTRGDRKVLRTVKLSRAEWLQLGAGIRIRHRLTFPCKNGYASCKASHALGHSSVHSGARIYVACTNPAAGTDTPGRSGRDIRAGGGLVEHASSGKLSARIRARRTDADGLQRPVVSAGQQSNCQGENARKRRKLKFPHGSSSVGNLWSGRRDLNPRLRPWQGRTLPLSYSRSAPSFYTI